MLFLVNGNIGKNFWGWFFCELKFSVSVYWSYLNVVVLVFVIIGNDILFIGFCSCGYGWSWKWDVIFICN